MKDGRRPKLKVLFPVSRVLQIHKNLGISHQILSYKAEHVN